jgi:hypothetical protein
MKSALKPKQQTPDYGSGVGTRDERCIDRIAPGFNRWIEGLEDASEEGCRDASTVPVARSCGRLCFALGLEVWRKLLGDYFKGVRDSGEQFQELVHTNFPHVLHSTEYRSRPRVSVMQDDIQQ